MIKIPKALRVIEVEEVRVDAGSPGMVLVGAVAPVSLAPLSLSDTVWKSPLGKGEPCV